MKKHHLHYTLIEVLVAIAVLALMMSFLFQFTSGAQRIWSATNTNTNLTTDADAIFALMDEDITQMIVDGSDEVQMPYTGSVSGSTADADFDFYAISSRKGGVNVDGGTSANKVGSLIYVRYHYDSGDKRLYRLQMSAEDGLIYSAADNTAPQPDTTKFDSYLTSDEKDNTLIAEDVASFSVTATPNDVNARPQILLVQVKLNPDETGTKNEQTFSKAYFPGMR